MIPIINKSKTIISVISQYDLRKIIEKSEHKVIKIPINNKVVV